jgi:hypothetical protein
MGYDLEPYASGEHEPRRPRQRVSDRSRLTALLLGVPLGMFGAHRFYAGKVGSGVVQLLTLGGLGLWWLADCVLIATGEFQDIEGRRILRWSEADLPTEGGGGRAGGGGSDQRVLAELDAMRTQMMEMEERVDFMERLLVRARESGQLGPPR